MLTSEYYTDHSLLVIGDVPSLQDSGRLSFSVPARGTTFYAEGDYIDYIDAENYTWSGRLTNEHPREILWHYNYTGVFSSSNPGPFLGTDMCETLNVPGSVLSPFVYIQLKVASSDNQKLVVEKAIKIKRENCPPDPLIRPGSNGIVEVNNEKNIHQLVVNELETGERKFQTIRLFDQVGRVYFSCNECTLTDLQLAIDNNTRSLPAFLVYAAKTESEVIVNAILNLRQ